MKPIHQFSQEALNNFMANAAEKFHYLINYCEYNNPKSISLLFRSNLLILRSLIDFWKIDFAHHVFRFQDEPIVYIIFIPNLTYEKLESSEIFEQYKELRITSSSIFQYSFFITNEEKTVTLSTVEWFSPVACNRPVLHRLNIFEKRSMKWMVKLTRYEKFLYYHGCELVMQLPAFQPFADIVHVSGYSVVKRNGTDFDVHGITPVIFKTAAAFYNFTDTYQPTLVKEDWLLKFSRPEPLMICINRTCKTPSVYFEVFPINTVKIFTRTSNVVANLQVYMFITPDEKYTPYEKFFLPFDIETWILLTSTFLITFVSIFIINNLSKSTRHLIYGHKVKTPAWNVISIFFGISQTQLPTKDFSRFILLLFIYFCLIFRTCFQSKFFEFMTSEPRRSPPKTIVDVIERGYTVYSMRVNKFHSGGMHRTEEW
jgi:hypothetical protein